MKKLILILGDQLDLKGAALRNFDLNNDCLFSHTLVDLI